MRTTRNRGKENRRARRGLSLLLAAMLWTTGFPGAVFAAEAAEAEETLSLTDEAVLNEEEDPWAAYLKELSDAGKAALRIRLDDTPVTGFDLYLQSGSLYDKTVAELVESGDLTAVERSDRYDGVWLLDKAQIDPDSHKYKDGYFYLYRQGTERAYDHAASCWYSDLYFGDDNLADVDYYTVSFEQGEREVLRLPEGFIHKKEYWYNSEAHVPDRTPSYLQSSYIESPGYLLAYWADENGKDTRTNYKIDHPVTLHPVFVNEQEAKYHHADFSSYANENLYYEWSYDEETEDNNAVPVVAANAEELMKALKDKKSTFVIVRGDVTLKASEVKKICDDNGLSYNPWDGGEGPLTFGSYSYPASGDFLIVEKGATLTLDQVEIHCAVNWETRGLYMTVQDGGKLVLKNNGGLEYAGLSVQPGGLVQVEKTAYRLDCDYLYNHGTIHFDAWEDFDRKKDIAYLPQLTVHNSFFNFTSGVLEAEFGTFDFDLDDNSWYFNDYNDEIGDMALVRMRNEGKMLFSKNCRLIIGGDSSVYQHDRYAQMPFVNNGSLSMTDVVSENALYKDSHAMQIEYGTLVNNGTLTLASVSGRTEMSESGTSIYPYGGGLYLCEARLINQGSTVINNTAGVGIRANGLFYDPAESKSLSRTSVDTPVPGGIVNSAGASFSIRNGKNAAGLILGTRTALDNAGTVTLDYATAGETEGSMALVAEQGTWSGEDASAVINNNGSVVNNAYIAWEQKEQFHWNGSPWTGSGREGGLLKGSGGGEPGPGPEPVIPTPNTVSGGDAATDPQPAITENTTALTLVKGQKFVLGTADWKSSNAKVLSVSKSNVTAKKAGKATLSRGVSSIDVTVVAPQLKKSESTISLIVGGEGQISVGGHFASGGRIFLQGAPEALPICFSSASPDVATVDGDGRLLAAAKGSSVISIYINGVLFKSTVKVADANTAKRDFSKPVALVPLQSISIRLPGFTPKKAVWSSDQSSVSAGDVKKGVAFEDPVVRITPAGKLTAVGPGTTTLTATDGSAEPVTLVVQVSEPQERTLHLNVDASKALSVYGVKGTPAWKAENAGIVEINKNKIKGIAAGETVLTATCEGFTYSVHVFVEDPAITGSTKPYAHTLNMSVGEEQTIALKQVYQKVLFTSNRNHVAYVDANGVITARSKGTAKLTAKVNGKNISIKVKVE